MSEEVKITDFELGQLARHLKTNRVGTVVLIDLRAHELGVRFSPFTEDDVKHEERSHVSNWSDVVLRVSFT